MCLGILGLQFLYSNVFAFTTPILLKGTLTQVEKNEYTHCYFKADNENEEMDLWPTKEIDCIPFTGKKVSVEIKPDKIKVAGNYGTMDVLWLTKISLVDKITIKITTEQAEKIASEYLKSRKISWGLPTKTEYKNTRCPLITYNENKIANSEIPECLLVFFKSNIVEFKMLGDKAVVISPDGKTIGLAPRE